MNRSRKQSEQMALAGVGQGLPALPSFPNNQPVIDGSIEFTWVMDDRSVQRFKGRIIDIRQLTGGVGYSSVTDENQRRIAFAVVLGFPVLFIIEIPTLRECRQAA